MDYNYVVDTSSLNQYAYCPPQVVHTPLNKKPLNCNYPFNVEKQYDNYLFPNRIPSVEKCIEKFEGDHPVIYKLALFVILLFLIIFLICRE